MTQVCGFFNQRKVGCVAQLSLCIYMASHLLLFDVNTAVDNNNLVFFSAIAQASSWTYFTPPWTKTIDTQCHEISVSWSKVVIQISYGQAKRVWVSHYYRMYTTNVKNNLNTWCETRLRYFLLMKCYELSMVNDEYVGIDIRNTLKYVLKDRDWTYGDTNRQRMLALLLEMLDRYSYPANKNCGIFSLKWTRFVRSERIGINLIFNS